MKLIFKINLFLIVLTAGFSGALAQEMGPKEYNFLTFDITPKIVTDELLKLVPEIYHSHPEFGILPHNAPCTDCYELIDRRTDSTRLFVGKGKDRSKFYSQACYGSLHYRDSQGFLRSYDEHIKPIVEGSSIYESNNQDYPLKIDAENGKTAFSLPNGDKIWFNKEISLIHKSLNGTITYLGLANWSNYSAGRDGVKIIDAWPGIDIELKTDLGKLKTDYIIKHNLGLGDGHLVFTDHISANSNYVLKMHEIESVDESTGAEFGIAQLLNVRGEGIYIEKAFGFDQSGKRENSKQFGYIINGKDLSLLVPMDWLNSTSLHYPVVIDPTVNSSATYTAGIMRFRYNGSFCFGGGDCGYNLTVPRPPNSTLTGATYSIQQQSLYGGILCGNCWMSDAAWRFQTSCGTTGYWGCNYNGTGFCTATNYSINNLVSCLAPACSGNVVFSIFNSYCWCSVNGTCNGSGNQCQRINNNTWIVTLIGNTIEYANVSNPITLSSTSVCAGASITASTSGQYGVPPYSYNWSFSSTGFPSVGSGASASITFPTAGSITLYSIITDACGITTTSSIVINVNSCCTASNSGPYCPGQTIQLNASGGGTYSWTGPNGFTSNLQNPTISNAAPSMGGVYTVTVTNGTGGTCTLTTTVVINQAPTITCPATLTLNGCNIPVPLGATTIPAFTALGGSTNGTSITYTDAAATISGCTETVIRTYTATLGSCTSSCTQTINRIVDTQAPVVTGTIPLNVVSGCSITAAPAAQTTVAGLEGLGITIADNCTLDANLVVTSTETSAGTCPLVITRTYTITDGCSNQVTVAEIINIGDMVNPTFVNFPPNVTVNCDVVPLVASVVINGSDNCTTNPIVTFMSETGTPSSCGYTLIRTWSVTDDCGNSITSAQTITVLPASAPIITLPLGLPTTLTYTNANNFTTIPNATYSNGSTGICNNSGTLTGVLISNYDPCIGGSITVNYTGNDNCNNPLSATHTINVTPIIPSVSIFSTLGTVNINQPTTLTATGNPTGGTYSWSPAGSLNTSIGSIVVATPSTPTTYTVTYDLFGCIATNTVFIAVNPLTVTVNSTTICSGDNTTLTATPSVVGGTYLWSPGGATTQSITVNPTSNIVYSVVYTLNGVSSPSSQGTITVNPTPAVTVNNPSVCVGSSATLTAVGNPTGGTYLWSPGGQTTASITVNTTTTTSYSVNYTLNGCIAAATSNVTVNSIPTVLVADTTICVGQSATLTATPSAAGGTYLWNNSQQTNSISVNPIVTTSYTVMYTLNGCNTTGTGVVTVNPIPTVVLSNATICAGDNTIITATGSPTGGTLAWTGSANTASTLTVSPVFTSNYSVTYTLNGCTSAQATGTVTVNPLPIVSVADMTICQGQPGTLSAIVNPAGGNFAWSQGGTSATITETPSSTSVYNLTYTANGCVGNAVSASIIVLPLPLASFSVNNTSGCVPLTVSLLADTIGQNATYAWTSTGAGSQIGANPQMTFVNGGCYDVTLIATLNGCANSTTSASLICVQNYPVANFYTSPGSFSENNQTLSFINTSIGASGYIWNFGDGSLSNEENPNHYFQGITSGETITLLASTSMECMDSISIEIPASLGEIYYIPNAFTPDGDKFNQVFKPVFTAGFSFDGFEMLIYNRWGELLFESHNPYVGWDGSYGLEGLDCPSGTYSYKVNIKLQDKEETLIIMGHVNLLR